MFAARTFGMTTLEDAHECVSLKSLCHSEQPQSGGEEPAFFLTTTSEPPKLSTEPTIQCCDPATTLPLCKSTTFAFNTLRPPNPPHSHSTPILPHSLGCSCVPPLPPIT